jgi:hypothetical protein
MLLQPCVGLFCHLCPGNKLLIEHILALEIFDIHFSPLEHLAVSSLLCLLRVFVEALEEVLLQKLPQIIDQLCSVTEVSCILLCLLFLLKLVG